MEEQLYDLSFTNGEKKSGYTLQELEEFLEENNYYLEPNATLWGIDNTIADSQSVGVYEDEDDDYGVCSITWTDGIRVMTPEDYYKRIYLKNPYNARLESNDPEEIEDITRFCMLHAEEENIRIIGGKKTMKKYLAGDLKMPKPMGRPRKSPVKVDENGRQYFETVVVAQGSTGRVYSPKNWIGSQVRVTLLDTE